MMAEIPKLKVLILTFLEKVVEEVFQIQIIRTSVCPQPGADATVANSKTLLIVRFFIIHLL